jgi:sec-independent protein translocase protein TatC
LIFIVAAILTPPDVISQILMAIPLLFLYEISIIGAIFFGKKKEKKTGD